ncbi:MAG: hypothetical protein KatS3mg105_2621 [Gemmatales bacterium]|nr:MAG: hypothetical protein KatS3mg105_2621 [Gemmatales bacterium]
MGAFFLASVIGLATSTPLFQKEWACVQSISGKGPVRYVAFTPDAKKTGVVRRSMRRTTGGVPTPGQMGRGAIQPAT